jgi:hypothetical protein
MHVNMTKQQNQLKRVPPTIKGSSLSSKPPLPPTLVLIAGFVAAIAPQAPLIKTNKKN